MIAGKVKLFQSLAILEYLDEKYPQPPLLPADPQARTWMRGLALINVADSHPLIDRLQAGVEPMLDPGEPLLIADI